MDSGTYQLSFTAGGLLHKEAVVLVGLYLRHHDWDIAARTAREQNLLQARTESSATRFVREIRKRLSTLSDPMLEVFDHGIPAEQQLILWIGICRRYELLRDFSREVVRERFLHLELKLSYDDFDRFLETKAVWHAEIDELATTTKAKLRQVTFRMLREAEILSDEDIIQPVLLSRELALLVQQEDAEEFLLFPVHETDVARVLA